MVVREESTWGAVHSEEEVGGEEKGKKMAKKGKGKARETPAEKVERRLRPQEIDPTLKKLDSASSSESASESESETLLDVVRELQGEVVEMKASLSNLADLAQRVKSETDNRTEFMRLLVSDF